MFNRKLAVVVLSGLAIAGQAGAVLAHGSFPFDEPYWKQSHDGTSVHQAEMARAPARDDGFSKYQLVDRYNP